MPHFPIALIVTELRSWIFKSAQRI
jgi:hypothetical protein